MQDRPNDFSNPDESRRSAIRAGVEIGAEIREQGYSYFKTRLIDISETGFRISHSANFEVGTSVYLKIPGLESLEAEVRWERNFEYGCMFKKPLYPAVFEHIVRYISAHS